VLAKQVIILPSRQACSGHALSAGHLTERALAVRPAPLGFPDSTAEKLGEVTDDRDDHVGSRGSESEPGIVNPRAERRLARIDRDEGASRAE
jgi:hypothetical protein